jgi:hypothetical protein
MKLIPQGNGARVGACSITTLELLGYDYASNGTTEMESLFREKRSGESPPWSGPVQNFISSYMGLVLHLGRVGLQAESVDKFLLSLVIRDEDEAKNWHCAGLSPQDVESASAIARNQGVVLDCGSELNFEACDFFIGDLYAERIMSIALPNTDGDSCDRLFNAIKMADDRNYRGEFHRSGEHDFLYCIFRID